MVAIQNRRQYGPILSDSVIRVTPKREGIPNVKTAYKIARELCSTVSGDWITKALQENVQLYELYDVHMLLLT